MSEQTMDSGGGIGSPEAGPIVARAGSYYRRARYLVCAMIFIFGLWFCLDGYSRWPAAKARFNAATHEQQTEMIKPHSDTDILINQVLGVALPVAAIAMLSLFLYRSRGEYRLEARTLIIPGHPPIPLDRITELDRSQWDRKGILIVHYAVPGSETPAKAKLDDFVYERKGTDAIVAALTQQLFPQAAKAEGQSPER